MQVGTRVREEQLVAVKSARGSAAAARLEHEAALLRRIDHPGVVAFVDFVHRRGDQAELITRFAGHSTLATAPPADRTELYVVLASVCATVADLHTAAIVHGNIVADHVIVAPDGPPQLCSLGSGRADADENALSDDVQALAALVEAALERPRPSGLLGRRRRQAGTDPPPPPALTVTLQRCRADDIGLRPSAVTLANRLAQLSGDQDDDATESAVTLANRSAQPSGDQDDDATESAVRPARLPVADRPTVGWPARVPLPRRDWRPRPRRVLVVAVTTAIIAAALAVGLQQRSGSDVSGNEDRASETGQGSAAAGPTPPARECPARGTYDVDGDGCPDDVEVHAGRVRIGDSWVATGEPGAVVRLGDWNCDGRDTVSLLRPASGEVFVFDDWPTATAVARAPRVALVPGGVDLEAPASADPCPPVVVLGRGGTRTVVTGGGR